MSETEHHPFTRCDKCGQYHVTGTAHRCKKKKRIKTRETRQAQIDLMERSSQYDPEKTVVMSLNSGHKSAYHKPSESWMYGIMASHLKEASRQPVPLELLDVDCPTTPNKDKPWQAMDMETAHSRDIYPCGHCFDLD